MAHGTGVGGGRQRSLQRRGRDEAIPALSPHPTSDYSSNFEWKLSINFASRLSENENMHWSRAGIHRAVTLPVPSGLRRTLQGSSCLAVLLCSIFPVATNAQTPLPHEPQGTSLAGASQNLGQTQSLADTARAMRKNKQAEIQMSPDDAKELFQSVDKIFEFASEDSGLPRKHPVKRQLVGAPDVEKFFKEKLAREEYSQRFAR